MPDWSQTALVFPGQGSQAVGMGADIAQAHPAAAQTFAEADDLLGFKLSALCFDGPEADLNDTTNTQPALYVMGVAVLRALHALFPALQPLLVAGHSLGELTALTAAGALPFADGVRLVHARGLLMAEAGRQSPGAMAAVLGLDADPVRAVCAQASQQTGARLVLANDNCPGQVVISGDESALEVGMDLCKQAGAKRVVKLAVSIAAHSPLMESAQAAFREAVAQANLTTPHTPIIGNVHAAPLQTVADLQAELANGLTHPVRWTESVRAMRQMGVAQFYELGSKDVLNGLIKRIDREAGVSSLNSAAALAALVG
jgi:[acyl-carrier-protein] S-malonyltransferase